MKDDQQQIDELEAALDGARHETRQWVDEHLKWRQRAEAAEAARDHLRARLRELGNEIRQMTALARMHHPHVVGCNHIDKWADLLAILSEPEEAQQTEKEPDHARVVDSQYGAPLATAAENQTVPAQCASCGVSIHRYGVRLVRLGDGKFICADCFYQQRDAPKG